jgi:tetratricopeptide (TPR) repeat protein
MRALIALFILFPILLQAQSLQKAKVLYETGKPAEALKLLEEIADDSKDYAEAQYYLGRIAFDKNEYDDAAEYFEEATEANDKNRQLLSIGWAIVMAWLHVMPM